MTSNRSAHWLSVVFPDVIDFPGNEGIIVPSGTTAERPLIPTNGLIRYNVSGGILEAYINGIWENLLGTGGGIGNEFISLIDTFPNYTGRGGHLLKVNPAETGIESLDIGTGFLPNAGGIMDLGSNITMASGELLGLPATPSVPNAAASKTYVDGLLVSIPSRIQDSDNNGFVDVDYDFGGGTKSITLQSSFIPDGPGSDIGIQCNNGDSDHPGGAVRIFAGGGGDIDVIDPGFGGGISIRGGFGGLGPVSGTAPSDKGGDGGSIDIRAGSGNGGFYPGAGGTVSINGGDQGFPSANNANGGSIILMPGNGGTNVGGSTGAPGTVYIGRANLRFPNSDGSSGDVLITNGSGILSFSALPVAATPQAWSSNLYPGSRTFTTTYTNSTGGPITVNVIVDGSGAYSASLFVDGVAIVRHDSSPGTIIGTRTLSVVVPDGSDYNLVTSEAILAWYELS